MKSNPKITVAVPVYKVENYLKSCIDSITGQSYENLDILLILQPCDDDSEKLSKELAAKDERIRLVYMDHADLADARNESIKNAPEGCEWITFIDSDDLVHRDYIKIMYELAERTEADIVQVKSYAFHHEENLPEEVIGSGSYEVVSGREFELRRQKDIYKSWATVVQTKLYRFSLFEGVAFPGGRVCEDMATTYRLYDKAKTIAVLDNEIYFYRSHRADSITHDESRLERLMSHAYLARSEMEAFFRGKDKEIADYCAYYLCGATIRTKQRFDKKTLKKNEVFAGMLASYKTYYKYVLHSDIKGSKKALTVLGRYFPGIWYRSRMMRRKRRHAKGWKDTTR